MIPHAGFRRVFVEHASIPMEGSLEILKLLLEGESYAPGQRQAPRRIVGGLEADFVNTNQRAPIVTRGIDRFQHLGGNAMLRRVKETLKRRDRRPVVGVIGQRRTVMLDGAVRILQRLLVDHQTEMQRDGLRQIIGESQPSLQQIGEIGEAPAGDVESFERHHSI